MTKTELLEIIANGESSGIDFKRDVVDARGLAKTLVAFANFRGGRVLLGVDDDGTVVGLTRPEVEEWVMAVCRDKIRPAVIPYFEIVRDVAPGRDVAVVGVERGWAVHHLWHANRRVYHIRVGTRSDEANPEELARLFQQRQAFRVDVVPVSGSSRNDLDARRLRDYFERIRGQELPEEADDSGWTRFLVDTEVLTETDEGAPCTVAGLLLFGRRPARFLPQAGIDAAAFPAHDKDYAARERLRIRGPLVALFRTGADGRTEVEESGVVEQAAAFVRRNTSVAAEIRDGARREERPDYPEEVIREAVVNALVHRDYLQSATTVELALFADRLELVSPGNLPNGITVDRMRAGCRAARNPLLRDVMQDYGYLESMGMGIPRKIVRGMRQHNGTEPDLVAAEERFTLRLTR